MTREKDAKRIDTTTSRTAEWTCLARAVSSLETEPHYRCDDDLAAVLAPGVVRTLFGASLGRAFYRRFLAPRGLYEYVIARTKYIDAAFHQALHDRFAQVVLFGAGFDTRALRFQADLRDTEVYELDVPITQQAKLGRYRERRLAAPANLRFVAIDFDRESIAQKLHEAGFHAGLRSLFVLEGVLMYLMPESVDATFRTLQTLAGPGSRVVFDYVRASVLRGEETLYGEKGARRAVADVNEAWHFGLDPERVPTFLSTYGFTVTDHQDAAGLERLFFQDPGGRLLGRINATHCVVTAHA